MDDKHRGVVWLDKYQIYPENRLGNTLYSDKKLLVSDPNQMILEIMDISGLEGLVYLYANQETQMGIGLYDATATQRVEIKRVDDEFYEIRDRNTGTQKIFRIYQGKLQSIFARSRTATQVTPAKRHVAFYHINSSKTVTNAEGIDQRIYSFRIHVLKRTESEPYTLPDTVDDTLPYLKLSWVNVNTLRYILSNGEAHDLILNDRMPADQL
ncbi:hypothetical protein WDW89_06745 [Deltaproteobacteria bacterium TL4]